MSKPRLTEEQKAEKKAQREAEANAKIEKFNNYVEEASKLTLGEILDKNELCMFCENVQNSEADVKDILTQLIGLVNNGDIVLKTEVIKTTKVSLK